MTVHALLLNASWEILGVVPARRAVKLILSGKAESLEVGEACFRSASETVAVPSVLRLRTQVKVPYRATVPLTRKAVLARDENQCQFTHCNRTGDTMDHVMPRSRGGKHTWENVVTACKRCNAKKDDKLMSEIGWKLKRQPYAPKAWFYMVFRFELDPAWVPYLPAQS